MSFLAGLSTGGGGLSGETSQTAHAGNADVRAATGAKTFNIGGNPNVASALQSPWVVIAVAVVAVVWLRRR